jgi:cysteine synthase A
MATVELEHTQTSEDSLARTRKRFKEAGIKLPKFKELRSPGISLKDKYSAIEQVDPDSAHPLNLFRLHWFNTPTHRGLTNVPSYLVIPGELLEIDAKIIVMLGRHFPMISAHKVLPAYACLVPRILSGEFDLDTNRAIWPSTGNYCRGGVAISRILGCRATAVLPEGMSAERFNWLKRWVSHPDDILRTPGTESNVKEIYDACHELSKGSQNVIINQFSEYGNYMAHRYVTGPALEAVFNAVNSTKNLCPRAFVAASGSAGTLAAGDYLKQSLGTHTCVVEATECPTLLKNGYGDHNIQGIGDKHVPLIHNVMGTDFVIGVSDKSTDSLSVIFNTDEGQNFLAQTKNLNRSSLEQLTSLGLSGLSNVIASVKYAKYMNLGKNDVVMTVATDGAELYLTELEHAKRKYFSKGLHQTILAESFGRHMLGIATDNIIELTRLDKERIFNLGYYTWVEQQGVTLKDFDARRAQSFWDDLVDYVPVLDEKIEELNQSL